MFSLMHHDRGDLSISCPHIGVAFSRPRVHVGASSSLIQQANAVVLRNAPQLNMAQRHMAIAIGNFETGFGVSGSWLFDDGRPSYNWGGLVGSGTAGSLTHGDIAPDGTPVKYGFQAFNNMDEGFRAFLGTWKKADTMEAAARGDALGTARAMYGHHYFGGTKGTDEDRIRLYGKGIFNGSNEVANILGEPHVVVAEKSASKARSVGGVIVVTGACAAIAYWLYKEVI